MPVLENEKVLLSPLDKQILPLSVKWLNDPEVIQGLLIFLPLTEIAEEKWIEKTSVSENDVVFIIKKKMPDGTTIPIGICGLHGISWKDRCGTFGIFIGEKDSWGSGLGPEAGKLLIRYGFEQLNLNRINSSVIDFNQRSVGMHEKLGFRVEGKKRQMIFKNNRFADEIILGLLKEEWQDE
ncbi:MAG TPA: GNAT family protein [Candidatus Moranbacteria bacterium]|nr:GNAT family protein [Candidatus Moranbacteria bacterium]